MQPDLGNALLQTASTIEGVIDQQLDQLKEIDDFEALRALRLQQLKKEQENRQRWLHLGHGTVTIIQTEKDFFNETKGSEHCIVHFHRPSSKYSDILGQHLKKLSEMHLETKFCQINAEKSQFLCERLEITIIPTLVFIENGKVNGKIEGLEQYGGAEMSTYKLERTIKDLKFFDYLKLEPETAEEYGDDD
ncbi:putative Thioredoxin [Blattamonas nauphoetae]|uniref:Thioredoxin n=1 Tax=Blattamonas nauphoetae TaxID=2049346 RepID=A0ABQ9YML6_9EUKA|nr:putative Thioredoxin [Blattamonas nauphoetae]